MAKPQKKNNFISILAVSFYLFFVLGFILHTSAHPVLFGRYTVKYFLLLCILVIFSPIIFIFVKRLTSKISKKTFIFLIILLLIALFSISEIFLRIKYKNYESTNYRATIDNFDPFLQAKLTSTDNIGSNDLHINSFGFRGEEIQQKKPNDTFRIVVLGGSTVLNREVTYEKNAARLLEKKLRVYYPDKKIEVINAGKDGYTSEHSLIQYLFKVKDFDPDLVIMWHGGNDLGTSCTIEGFTHGEYKSDYTHELGPMANLVFSYFQPQPIIQIKLLSVDFLTKMIKDNLYSDLTNSIKAAIVRKNAEEYKAKKTSTNVHDFPSLVAYKRNLLYMIDFTKQNNTPLILGNQPNLFILNPTIEEIEKINFPRPLCQKNDKYYDLESLHYGITLFNNATKEVANQNNIEFVDLDSKIPKNLSYFFDSVHYTEKGNEVIADTLFKEIVDKNFIN